MRKPQGQCNVAGSLPEKNRQHQQEGDDFILERVNFSNRGYTVSSVICGESRRAGNVALTGGGRPQWGLYTGGCPKRWRCFSRLQEFFSSAWTVVGHGAKSSRVIFKRGFLPTGPRKKHEILCVLKPHPWAMNRVEMAIFRRSPYFLSTTFSPTCTFEQTFVPPINELQGPQLRHKLGWGPPGALPIKFRTLNVQRRVPGQRPVLKLQDSKQLASSKCD